MNKKTNFYTIFPLCQNVHLIKDVGMIPYYLHKKHGFNSVLVTYKNGDYPYLLKEVEGLKIQYLKKISGIPTIDIFIFLLFNSRKIDILNCFHFMRSTLNIVFFFRLITFFSKKKKVYLKLDASVDIDKIRPKSKFQSFVAKNIDVISVENKTFFEQLNKENVFKKEVIYIPNGFKSEEKTIIDYSEKENFILTVGRIGSEEKANDILLKGFEIFSRKNKEWKLFLVGPIEESFQEYIDNFYIQYPDLKELVFFTGAIYDRHKLEEYYKKATIFVLSSKFEGFPLVFLEAIKNGCTIVTTDFPSARDICENRKYGQIFQSGDFQGLASVLDRQVKEEQTLKENAKTIQELAYEKYDWNVIITHIFNNLS